MPITSGKDAEYAMSIGLTADPAKPVNKDDVLYDSDGDTDADMEIFNARTSEVTINLETRTDEINVYGDDFEEAAIIMGRWNVDINAYYSPESADANNTEKLFVAGLLTFFKQKFTFWPAGRPATEPAAQATALLPRYLGRCIIGSTAPSPIRTGVATLRGRLVGDGVLFRDID